MNPATQMDIGELITPQACGHATPTAAGSGDATEVDGAWIDRLGYSSAKLVIYYSATLTEAKTLSLAANMQDASDSG